MSTPIDVDELERLAFTITLKIEDVTNMDTDAAVRVRAIVRDAIVSDRATVAARLRAGDELERQLKELHALVKGECPSLLDEDRGGRSGHDEEITTALAAVAAARGKGGA